MLFSLSFWYFYYITFRRFCQGVFEIFYAGTGNQYQSAGFMRFQSLGLPSHSLICFQYLREPYPATTSRVFVFLYAFNVLFICSISLSRGFCSPLFLYLLYHKFPDLSIVFSKKIKFFFTFSGLIAGLPFLALVSKNCLNYQNLVNFGGARPCAAKKKKRLPALPFFLIYSVYTFLAFILSVLVSVYVNVSGSNAFSITSISRSK